MRISLAVTLTALVLAPVAVAQRIELRLDHLKAKASEASEVDLDGPSLEAFGKVVLDQAVREHVGDKAEQVRKLLARVRGVYVRDFEFDKPGEYSASDVESVLGQVRGNPAWSRLVSVKDGDEHVEVHVMRKGDEVAGLLVVAAEPKELTVVNIVGPVGFDEAKELVSSAIHYDLSRIQRPMAR
jgi:hypothetical protein